MNISKNQQTFLFGMVAGVIAFNVLSNVQVSIGHSPRVNTIYR